MAINNDVVESNQYYWARRSLGKNKVSDSICDCCGSNISGEYPGSSGNYHYGINLGVGLEVPTVEDQVKANGGCSIYYDTTPWHGEKVVLKELGLSYGIAVQDGDRVSDHSDEVEDEYDDWDA